LARLGIERANDRSLSIRFRLSRHLLAVGVSGNSVAAAKADDGAEQDINSELRSGAAVSLRWTAEAAPFGPGESEQQRVPTSVRYEGGTDRCYGAGDKEVATSSPHLTDGVPQCPSQTTWAGPSSPWTKIARSSPSSNWASPESWLISDIYLDGANSEAATRRSEFGAILKSDSIDGLIAALNRKADGAARGHGR